MTNDELTPVEALCALAHGAVLTRRGRRSKVTPDGYLVVRGKSGQLVHEVSLTGWRRLPKKRDVGTDPKVGDVLSSDRVRVTVLYVDAKYVLCEQAMSNGTYPVSCTRVEWIEQCKEAKSVKRATARTLAAIAQAELTGSAS